MSSTEGWIWGVDLVARYCAKSKSHPTLRDGSSGMLRVANGPVYRETARVIARGSRILYRDLDVIVRRSTVETGEQGSRLLGNNRHLIVLSGKLADGIQ